MTADGRYRPHVARLKARSAWRPLELAFWILPIIAFFAMPGELALLSQAAIMGLLALSLDLLLGYGGIVSLGHAAFFGVGAYTAGIVSQHGWGEPLTGLLLAGLAAGLIGFVTSFLVLRGGELTRLMVTLGIAMMLYELANKMSWLTGGADGLQGVEVWKILGLWDFDMAGRVAYVYAMVVMGLVFLLVRRLVNSPFGFMLRGIKENERRMLALGTPVARRLVAVYILSAVIAGIAGGLLTQTTQFVSLEVLAFPRSAEALLVVVLGGVGTLYGPIVGAVAFKLMEHGFSAVTPQYWQFWMGVIFIAIVMLARGGILGVLVKLRGLGRGRRAQPAPLPSLPAGE